MTTYSISTTIREDAGRDFSLDTPRPRAVFLDNLRTLMVLLVLVFHSGASYGSMVPFWPYHDPHPSELVDILMITGDVFMMTILFFIAGYFALPSLLKKGGSGFLKDKFRRLGIPWLVITISVLPVLDYLHYFTKSVGSGFQPHGYGTHWLLSMKKIAEFRVGLMHMGGYLNMTEHFYQRYLWFLSLLLLFFIVFWLVYQVYGRIWRPSDNQPKYVACMWVGMMSIVMFAAAKVVVSSLADPMDLAWFSLGNIFQFQLAKLAFYIPAFGLGVHASLARWFTNAADAGRPAAWGWSVFVLMVANMLVARTMLRIEEPSLGLQTAFLVLYPLWTLSFLGFFVSLASRRWNSATFLNRELAANSYNMYLVHYIFVLTLPLLVGGWSGGNVLIKFGMVAMVTVLLSYAASRFILTPQPRKVLAGLLTLNVLLALFS